MISSLSLAQPQLSYSTINKRKRNQSNVVSFQKFVYDIEKYQAKCCYNVPIPKNILSKFEDKIVNPIIATKNLGFSKKLGERNILPFTDLNPYKNKCPFLTATNSCNIHDDRPALCKFFGSIKRKGCELRHQNLTSDDIAG